jgi:hypothetical protein
LRPRNRGQLLHLGVNGLCRTLKVGHLITRDCSAQSTTSPRAGGTSKYRSPTRGVLAAPSCYAKYTPSTMRPCCANSRIAWA